MKGKTNKYGVPEPTYMKDKNKLQKAITKAYKQMLDYLVLELSFNPDNPHAIREQEIMRQVNYWLKEMNEQLGEELERLIKKTFQEGAAYHRLSVKEVGSWSEAMSASTFNALAVSKVSALFRDTYSDILLATNNTAESVKTLVRDTVSKVARYHSLTNEKYSTQANELAKELSKKGMSEKVKREGFVGITDSAGRKWDLKTYSNMVIKTKVNQAFMQGVIHDSETTGLDLAVISNHGAEDACSKWEGMVISMTGKTKGYITYKQAKATNEIFHPNCEHKVHPIRGLDMLHEDDVALHMEKARKIGDVDSRAYKKKRKK
ncbi:phage minor capsid protein [Rummeliibacillus stabekisii]|uniref:phage minor capsid protein n=1 Tax=Rummeliibacillus stabekisii TaxID=241244 RepID=UPI00371084B6